MCWWLVQSSSGAAPTTVAGLHSWDSRVQGRYKAVCIAYVAQTDYNPVMYHHPRLQSITVRDLDVMALPLRLCCISMTMTHSL